MTCEFAFYFTQDKIVLFKKKKKKKKKTFPCLIDISLFLKKVPKK